jgi:hypothetical protein
MHSSLKLIPGVDQTKTPALNEAAISQSQLIRFMPDRTLGGIIQKLGGWTKYIGTSMGSIVRALWGWEDINNNSYLAAGCLGKVAGGALQVITSGVVKDVTPIYFTESVTPQFTTTSGSNAVKVTITGAGINQFDSIWLKTQIAVGGVVLFGTYQVYNDNPPSGDDFYIYATDAVGNPVYATSSVTNGGSTPYYTTANATSNVTVTLTNHGYLVGSTFTALIATSVGGVTIYGNYEVYQVVDANNFIIISQSLATSTASAYMNSDNAYFYVFQNGGPQTFGSGYGVGYYGEGGYGTGYPITGVSGNPITAIDWTLDNWGEDLVACPYGGDIYVWSPNFGYPSAQAISDAPPVNAGMFVAMPQRQIMAWGSTYTGIQDPMQVRWSDVGDYSVWKPSVTNQAGGYRIPKGSRIVQGIQSSQQALFWTDVGLWVAQYIGPTDVYGFNEVGTGCGLIGRKAAGSMNGITYWMSQTQFYNYGGGGTPTPMKCPVWDVAFQDLDTAHEDNIRFAANSQFGEIAWYYPVQGSNGENTNYVKYNVFLDQWDYGTLSRTAWINQSVLGPPIGAGPDYFLYQHETSPDADGQPMNSYFQTGYFVLNEADLKMFVDQVWPDMKWGYYGGSQGANVILTFYVTDYPGQTPLTYGPFTLTQATTYVTPRFRGRLVSIRLESNDINSFWRLGNIRYRVQEDGKY